MTVDVGTTPRKPLTPTQRLKLFEEYAGRCVLCTNKIHAGEPWRDEHLRALGLGGTNEWDNRAPVHERCAKIKDKADLSRIAKAKRQKIAAHGMKRSKQPFRGWRRFDGTIVLAKDRA
jgi:5-methylcytosine-specific restriction enzyme A